MICNDLVRATVLANNAGTMFLITQNLSQVAIQRKKEGLHASIAILNLKVCLLNGKEANFKLYTSHRLLELGTKSLPIKTMHRSHGHLPVPEITLT